MGKAFEVSVPQAKLDRIVQRVRDYPWFPAPEGEQWEFGINTAFLKDICAYWVDGYDWRARQAELNQFPQAITNIGGLDVHYVHVRGEGNAAQRPLILTHGWPGSHYEFWEAIPKLAFPSKHGGDTRDAFDVIAPSLPGYGFSGKPKKMFGQRATADAWNKLMTQELGYKKYIAQGGDWGGMVTSFLGLDHDACVGIHLNMIGFAPEKTTPQTDEERNWIAGVMAGRGRETAYMQEQTTKPQTLAMALMDSPVGTAAWILEKFHGWSDTRKGGLLGVYSKDQLLTNVMIYVVTDSIATSVWYYRARAEEAFRAPGRFEKPMGAGNFKGEPFFKMAPRSWVERIHNVVHWSEFEEGGHFAAMEKPELFAQDVRKFARTISF